MDINDQIESLIKGQNATQERIEDEWLAKARVVTRNGVQYYADGKHAGKKVGTVRKKGGAKEGGSESMKSKIEALATLENAKAWESSSEKWLFSEDILGDLMPTHPESLDVSRATEAGLAQAISRYEHQQEARINYLEEKFEEVLKKEKAPAKEYLDSSMQDSADLATYFKSKWNGVKFDKETTEGSVTVAGVLPVKWGPSSNDPGVWIEIEGTKLGGKGSLDQVKEFISRMQEANRIF